MLKAVVGIGYFGKGYNYLNSSNVSYISDTKMDRVDIGWTNREWNTTGKCFSSVGLVIPHLLIYDIKDMQVLQ